MAKFLRPSKKSLQNPQHYEFINAFLTTIVAAGLPAAKIIALVTQLTTAFQEEDRLYIIARASQLIAQRDAADKGRDDFYARLHRLVLVWAGSGDPTMDPAATLLKPVFDLYKVKTSAQLEVESGQLSNLITALLAADMQAAIATLHGEYLFQQMKAYHEQVQAIRLEEGVEQSEKVSGALVAARKQCDALYDQITYLIEAYSLTADDPAPYEAYINRWNGTLQIYQDILDRKSGGSGSSSNNGGGSNSGDNGGGSGDNGGDTPTPDNPDTPDTPDTPDNPDNPTPDPDNGGGDNGGGSNGNGEQGDAE